MTEFTKPALLLSIFIFFLSFSGFSQRTCGTMDYYQQQLEENSGLINVMQQFEEEIKQMGLNEFRSERNIVTIPVVFHIVYRTTAENITDNRCIEQLNILTEDFRRLNADASNTPSAWQGIASDTQIEFCLAKRDPQGNPTTGITRTQTSTTSFSGNSVKFNSQGGKDIWDRNKYLNIWVCNLSGGLLGFAQFPGQNASTDGVVIGYQYTGKTGASAPFNKGRTATHEVGHWLGLWHIWGDSNCGNDQVSDTPTQSDETYNCPSFPNATGCSSPNPPGRMFMNYMDYTNDACMNLFTSGQGTRMQSVLNSSRVSLKSSNGCTPFTTNDAGITAIDTPTGASCNTTFTPVVTLKNFGSNNLTSVTINYRIDNNPNQTFSWTGNLASPSTVNVTLPQMTSTIGAHTFTAFTTIPNSITDEDPSNDSRTGNFTIATTPAQPGTISGSSPVCEGTVQNYIISSVSGATSYIWTLPSGWTGSSTSTSMSTVIGPTGISPSNIMVKATNSCGTSIDQTKSINVNPKPPVPTITIDGANLVSSATTGNQWYKGNSIISGATSQQYTPTVNAKYKVTVTDANGCKSTSAESDLKTVSVEENLNEISFKIFPNPAKEMINIVINEETTIQAVYISDIIGNTVKHFEILNSKRNLDYSINSKEIGSGVYFVTVQTEIGSKTQKLIIQ